MSYYEKINVSGYQRYSFTFILMHKWFKIILYTVDNYKEINYSTTVLLLLNMSFISGKVHSMKHHKTEVNSILKNVECGIMFESFLEEFQASDKIICYQIMQVPQNTSWNPGF